MPYSEFRHWSIVADQELIRLSMTNGRTQGEYFTFIKADDGKKLRERRDEALELIEQAISQGCEPGEVIKS